MSDVSLKNDVGVSDLFRAGSTGPGQIKLGTLPRLDEGEAQVRDSTVHLLTHSLSSVGVPMIAMWVL